MKTGLLYGIVASSKTRVRCVFCGVHIPKASRCIEQHTNGAKHKENIELMNENGIYLKEHTLHCKPCQKTLTEDDSITRHIEDGDHATWILAMEDLTDGEFINLEAFLSSENDEAYCDVCDTVMSCTLSNIEEHVNSINHRLNIVDKLKPLNGIFPVENDAMVWCKICRRNIENNIQNILNHIDDDPQHVHWLTEVEDAIENHDVNIDAFLSNKTEQNAYCNKCHVEIVCNLQHLETHVLSDFHLEQFSL